MYSFNQSDIIKELNRSGLVVLNGLVDNFYISRVNSFFKTDLDNEKYQRYFDHINSNN